MVGEQRRRSVLIFRRPLHRRAHHGALADHGCERIAIGAVAEEMRLDQLEAGFAKIVRDERGVAAVIERAPDGDGFGRKTTVREADDDRRAGPEHAGDVGEDLKRALEILDADTTRRGVEHAVGEWQPRARIEVLDDEAVDLRIGGEFSCIHAVADGFASERVGKMADTTRHEIENSAVARDMVGVEARQRVDGRRVDVRDESRGGIERTVI